MSSHIRETADQFAGKARSTGDFADLSADENRRTDNPVANPIGNPVANPVVNPVGDPAGNPADLPAAEGRDIAAILDPAPITVIGARNASGRVGFATVLWVTPISHNPAMLAFALRAKSHTMGLIRETGCFSMSTFPADAESVRIIETCGNNSGHKLDKGAEIEHSLIGLRDKEDTLLPVPNHALAWELCEVESIQETGDHLLIIGHVIKAASGGSRDEKGRLAPTETLLCVQHGAFAPVGEIL